MTRADLAVTSLDRAEIWGACPKKSRKPTTAPPPSVLLCARLVLLRPANSAAPCKFTVFTLHVVLSDHAFNIPTALLRLLLWTYRRNSMGILPPICKVNRFSLSFLLGVFFFARRGGSCLDQWAAFAPQEEDPLITSDFITTSKDDALLLRKAFPYQKSHSEWECDPAIWPFKDTTRNVSSHAAESIFRV